MYRLLLIV